MEKVSCAGAAAQRGGQCSGFLRAGKLGIGKYQEVLKNKKGSFYLAPPLGFYKRDSANDGYAVGGVYLPCGSSDIVYLWEYPLTNKERTMNSPSASRVLSKEFDQPERERFLQEGWYASSKIRILARPLIDTDFQISRLLFTQWK